MTLRDPRWLLPCVVGALGAGLIGFNALPIVVGALVDGAGLEPSRAGWLGSLELAGMAVSALMLAPRIGTLSLRRLGLGAALLAALAHGLSAWVDGFVALAALRLLAGLGEGAIVGVGNALIAASRAPDRVGHGIVRRDQRRESRIGISRAQPLPGGREMVAATIQNADRYRVHPRSLSSTGG